MDTRQVVDEHSTRSLLPYKSSCNFEMICIRYKIYNIQFLHGIIIRDISYRAANQLQTCYIILIYCKH